VARKRHSKQEIDAKLEHADELAAQGKLHKDIARSLGVSVMTFHRWRKARRGKLPGGADRRDPQRRPEPGTASLIEELERENARLRVLVTDLLLEKTKLEEALQPRGGRARRLLGRRVAQG